jgi:hypothetical protein
MPMQAAQRLGETGSQDEQSEPQANAGAADDPGVDATDAATVAGVTLGALAVGATVEEAADRHCGA